MWVRSATAPLRIFMPGAFAGIADALGAAWASNHDAPLTFHAFVPSGMLAEEIVAGAPVDVFVSANRRFMDAVVAAGRVRSPRRLAGNRLCAIVPAENPYDVRTFADLLRPDIRLVTPQAETDPCGQYIVELWDRAGVTDVVAAKSAVGTLMHSRGSGDLPGVVFDGRADAGVFYASEAVALGDRVAVIPFPEELDLRERITFWIGATTATPGGTIRPESEGFVAFLTGPVGAGLLTAHGFLPAPPPES